MIKIYKRNRHKLLHSNKNRKNTALVILPFSFILRFPLSTPYFIFCFRFFSILTASFRLFLKVYSVYLCRQLLFFFFFFFVCLSLLPFVFLTCFFGGRSLPKTVHKLSVLYDKKIFSFPLL